MKLLENSKKTKNLYICLQILISKMSNTFLIGRDMTPKDVEILTAYFQAHSLEIESAEVSPANTGYIIWPALLNEGVLTKRISAEQPAEFNFGSDTEKECVVGAVFEAFYDAYMEPGKEDLSAKLAEWDLKHGSYQLLVDQPYNAD